MDTQRVFTDGQWYNTKQAYTLMREAGTKISRTTFWRRVSEGKVKWRLRKNFPGKWFKGRDLNSFFNAVHGA